MYIVFEAFQTRVAHPKDPAVLKLYYDVVYCPRQNYYWIISEKGGSSNFQDLFTGINRFQTDSSNLSCQRKKAWKLLQPIINSKQGPSRKKNQ